MDNIIFLNSYTYTIHIFCYKKYDQQFTEGKEGFLIEKETFISSQDNFKWHKKSQIFKSMTKCIYNFQNIRF